MSNSLKFQLKNEGWPLAVIIATIAVGCYAYPLLPTQVATHWGLTGAADGYSSRQFHVWFFPTLIAVLYLFLLIAPYLDPKRDRYNEFIGAYHIIKNVIITVMFIIFAATTAFNLGYKINIPAIIGATVGVLFVIMGKYFKTLKPNWFIGIRTPWTMSSETVWRKTHLLGGKLFMLWGLGLIVAPWLPPKAGITIFIAGAILATLGTIVYSYIIYRQER